MSVLLAEKDGIEFYDSDVSIVFRFLQILVLDMKQLGEQGIHKSRVSITGEYVAEPSVVRLTFTFDKCGYIPPVGNGFTYDIDAKEFATKILEESLSRNQEQDYMLFADYEYNKDIVEKSIAVLGAHLADKSQVLLEGVGIECLLILEKNDRPINTFEQVRFVKDKIICHNQIMPVAVGEYTLRVLTGDNEFIYSVNVEQVETEGQWCTMTYDLDNVLFRPTAIESVPASAFNSESERRKNRMAMIQLKEFKHDTSILGNILSRRKVIRIE